MSEKTESGKTNIYLNQRPKDYVNRLAKIMDSSSSEIVEDMIKYVREEKLEKTIWGSYWTVSLEEFEAAGLKLEDEEESEEEEE